MIGALSEAAVRKRRPEDFTSFPVVQLIEIAEGARFWLAGVIRNSTTDLTADMDSCRFFSFPELPFQEGPMP